MSTIDVHDVSPNEVTEWRQNDQQSAQRPDRISNITSYSITKERSIHIITIPVCHSLKHPRSEPSSESPQDRCLEWAALGKHHIPHRLSSAKVAAACTLH